MAEALASSRAHVSHRMKLTVQQFQLNEVLRGRDATFDSQRRELERLFAVQVHWQALSHS